MMHWAATRVSTAIEAALCLSLTLLVVRTFQGAPLRYGVQCFRNRTLACLYWGRYRLVILGTQLYLSANQRLPQVRDYRKSEITAQIRDYRANQRLPRKSEITAQIRDNRKSEITANHRLPQIRDYRKSEITANQRLPQIRDYRESEITASQRLPQVRDYLQTYVLGNVCDLIYLWVLN